MGHDASMVKTRTLMSIVFITVHLISSSFALSIIPVTVTDIEKLAQASSLSYLTMEDMSSSSYYTDTGLVPVVQLVEPKTQSGVTVFKDMNRLIVSSRGSATPKNFLTNLRFKLVSAEQLCSDAPDGGLVHEGFQEASINLWNILKPALLETINSLESSGNIDEIVFTGHSLGAATALLCAVQFTEDTSFKKFIPPAVLTFGGPKLCNEILAKHMADAIMPGSQIIHMVHDKDPILANNKQVWDQYGFEHVGVEVNVEPTKPIIYQDENEKPKSSFLPSIAWNILDHCMYAGVFMGPRIPQRT